MTIQGLSHITLIVHDLDRTTELFTSLLGAKEVYSSGERKFSLAREKFFLLAGTWIAIMEGPPSAPSYNHIAFKIAESDLAGYKRRLEAAGIEFREERPRLPGEGLSLYFYDFDNHLFELHTGTLEERLRTYTEN